VFNKKLLKKVRASKDLTSGTLCLKRTKLSFLKPNIAVSSSPTPFVILSSSKIPFGTPTLLLVHPLSAKIIGEFALDLESSYKLGPHILEVSLLTSSSSLVPSKVKGKDTLLEGKYIGESQALEGSRPSMWDNGEEE
ncbi:unnamed protein product, partial [Ilex paraguariensis]